MTLPVASRRTEVSTFIKAPREVVYQAFLDPDAVAQWLAPDTMKGQVDIYEPHKGGRFRISLTYLDPSNSLVGKTSEDTDTSEGTFLEVVPNEKIIQTTEFKSNDPDFSGEMKITWSLADSGEGTEITVLMEGIPKGIRLDDNELGSQQSLRKLASFVENGGFKT